MFYAGKMINDSILCWFYNSSVWCEKLAEIFQKSRLWGANEQHRIIDIRCESVATARKILHFILLSDLLIKSQSTIQSTITRAKYLENAVRT